MEIMDQLIEVLKRLKRCDKALNNLKMARDNCIFNEDMKIDETRSKYLKHVQGLLDEAIKIIEDEREQKLYSTQKREKNICKNKK